MKTEYFLSMWKLPTESRKLDLKQNGGWGIKYDSVCSLNHQLIYSCILVLLPVLHICILLIITQNEQCLPWVNQQACCYSSCEWVWSSFLNDLCNCCEWIYWVSLTTRQTTYSCQGRSLYLLTMFFNMLQEQNYWQLV